ncbi:MAG: DUF4290 domain-containing protein [Bacteroidetes bacterium]|nr:DUF4290 domain-containing protein [Bacteroidota bacterium]
MEYNTSRGKLVISEYGRIIQEMINKLLQIDDRLQRTMAAHYLVGVMAQLNPHLKESEDYLHKLWDHLHIMSDFKLDVESPYPVPERSSMRLQPKHIGYAKNERRHGHYGSIVLKMINEGVGITDPAEREAFAIALANQMKRLYLTYNKDAVNDAVILKDLHDLSGGQLTLPENTKLQTAAELITKTGPQAVSTLTGMKKKKPNKKQQQQQQFQGGQKKKHK